MNQRRRSAQAERCITRGVVGSILPVPYGNGNLIFQTPDEVVISYEMIHDTRVIPLNGRPHIGSKIRQYLGEDRALAEDAKKGIVRARKPIQGDLDIGGRLRTSPPAPAR